MRSDTIQQIGKHFGCLTFASVVIGVVYLAGAVFSFCFGTTSWAIRGLKIAALLIGIPLVLWGILFGVVLRVRRHADGEEPDEQVSPSPSPPDGGIAFCEIDADIDFDEYAPYAEAKYDAVLPVFSSVFVDCEDKGKSVQDFIRFFVNVYGNGVVPYLTRFIAESGAAECLWNEKESQQPDRTRFR